MRNGIDISKFPTVIDFLKMNSKGYQAKKSMVLSKQDLDRFMVEADDNMYLMIKVKMILLSRQL